MSDMQIVKVVVRGKLPKSCAWRENGNEFMTTCDRMCFGDGYWCDITGKTLETDYDVCRPLWCPLVLEDKEEKE